MELLKIEALAALGYMAKTNPSGMCSRWQMLFPREFSTATKEKKSSSLLASQKTLEKLMVFERSASVRSAACFAIISLLDCLLYTSPSPRDATLSRMPSSA